MHIHRQLHSGAARLHCKADPSSTCVQRAGVRERVYMTEISACVIPCMAEYLILPACVFSWYMCMYVCMRMWVLINVTYRL